MRAPAWLRNVSRGSLRWVQGKPEVVFRFTIDDQAYVEELDRAAEVAFQLQIATERVAAQEHVEALVDRLGHGYGIDPRVWNTDRAAEKRERRIAERRARLIERQDPAHPDFIGRRRA